MPCKEKETQCTYDHDDKGSGQFKFTCQALKREGESCDGQLTWHIDNDEESGGGEDFSLGPSECPKESPDQNNATPCKQEKATCPYDFDDKSCGQAKFKCMKGKEGKYGNKHGGEWTWKIDNWGELDCK